MSTYQNEVELENEYVMPTFARMPVCLVSGNGMHVQDDAGNDYLDFIGGIGVCCLGHNHPKVVKAITGQAEKLIHVSNYYYIEQRGEVAKLISEALNEGAAEGAEAWKTFFANSGAEANECAMKLARLYAKRKGNGGNLIITLKGSFHGRTMETLAATAQDWLQEAFQPLPGGFLAIPRNDIPALEQAFQQHGSEIAGVMFECIQGESGVHPCTPEFLQAARKLADQYGALLIDDEVQDGVYRTGKPFAFQNFGIVPDIVSIAKGIGGGFPMGACAAPAHIADVFRPGDHGSTFGGSNLACAAAHTVLHTLKDENIAENVQKVGAYLQKALAPLPHVTEVRGMGLMVACDLDEPIDAHQVVADALGQGLLLNATGPHTLRFLPPLVCSEADVDVLVKKLETLLASSAD